MRNLKSLSYFMMLLLVFGSFAPFATAEFNNPNNKGFADGNYGSVTNTYQSSRPNFDNFYRGSMDTYWPILTNLKKDQCDAVSSDFIIAIPPMGCSPMVVRSDLLAEQNVPVFCQLSAIKVNPLIDVSTIKSISFRGDYPPEVAGVSFHPARAAVKSYKTLIGSPVEENIGYVVIVLKRQPDERNLAEYVSGMLTATVKYDAQGTFGTGAGEYYLETMSDNEWVSKADDSSFWGGKGYLRVKNVDSNEATIEVLTSKDNVYQTLTLKEGETSPSIYYPGYYCTAALKLKLNKIDNSEDMAKIDVEGDSYWVRKGSRFLDGKCVVKDLNVFPNRGGDIEISCSGNSVFRLMLSDKGVVLDNGINVPVQIGGLIKGSDNNLYYLGYYGKNRYLENKDNNLNGDFVVLIDKLVSQDEVSRITGFFHNKEFENKEKLLSALDDEKLFNKKGKKYVVIPLDKDYNGIKFVSTGAEISKEKYSDASFIPHYTNKAEEAVSQLVTNFPAEKKENGEYWGEDALFKQIALAGKVGDEEMQLELIELFLDKYTGSKNTDYLRDLKVKLGLYNYEKSFINLFVNNDNYNIRVDGFVNGRGDSDSVNIRIGGREGDNLKKGKVYDENFNIIDLDEQKKVFPRLVVIDIDGKGARFNYVWKDEEDKSDSKDFRVDVGNYLNVGGETIYVIKTNVREVAHVSLIPEVRNTKTEANFTFNIGIEKRAIELSPEKARKKIKALNKSIAEWEEKIEKLGKLVKGLKGACFAVSTVLMFKSMFAGFVNGEAMARKDVMDFYEKKCREDHPGMDLQECYNTKFKNNIETAIDEYGKAVVEVNKIVKCAEDAGVDNKIWGSEVVNSEDYIAKLKVCAKPTGGWDVKIGKEEVKITEGDLRDAKDYQAILLYKRLCDSVKNADACEMARGEMEKQLFDNIERKKVGEAEDKVSEYVGSGPKVKFQSVLSKDTKNVVWDGQYLDEFEDLGEKVKKCEDVNEESISTPYTGVLMTTIFAPIFGRVVATTDKNDRQKIQFFKFDDKEYLLLLRDGVNGLKIESAYEMEIEKDLIEVEISKFEKFVFISPGKDTSCSNKMTTPYVRYHEKYNKQSFVAIVPFDEENGWYAFVPEDSYDEKGYAKEVFWICNVGDDNKIDGGPNNGKDRCQSFQASSAGVVANFIPCPKKTSSDVKKLYVEAEAKIMEANNNGDGVYLNGKFVPKTTPFADVSTGVDCTDFMSLDDCSLMFNVCDPVICPPSRCNFGGKFPVSDVIASGIIGSLVLCLPNFGDPSEGKVLIPICLSGVHAGLDAYVSILRSYRDCLETNIETGEYVGICDEISSIYMCEFFWGQLSPILDTIIVRFAEAMYGGFQVRGGAEYLTVQKSFENLDNSINYFTSTYARGAFRAFTLKNTEEIGSMICKGFVGSSVPTSADLIDSLLEPESPTQFHAFFSDDVFSEATVPSTSHYKVYYHIYAGNDAGTQYKVYLKNPPASSYYANRPTLMVDSGFVEKGATVSETIDFTAPTGYKELCVNINGQDECGFGSVGSSFALDYVSQSYINDQANDRQIERTDDCITTSASAWGMANPNVQAGAEKSLDFLGGDDIATSGIIRICASTNPEQGVVSGNDVYCNVNKGKDNNPECGFENVCEQMKGEDVKTGVGICQTKDGDKQVSMKRWVDVGYCDVPSVRCWLDSKSVEDNLDVYMAVNDKSVDELVRDSKEWKELEDEYKNVKAKLNGQRGEMTKLDFDGIDLTEEDDIDTYIGEIVENLNEIVGLDKKHTGQGTNADKAEALALKASVYMTVVKALLRNNPERVDTGGKEVKEEEGVDAGECGKCISTESFYCTPEECEIFGEEIGKKCEKGIMGCKEVEGEMEGDGEEGDNGDNGDDRDGEVNGEVNGEVVSSNIVPTGELTTYDFRAIVNKAIGDRDDDRDDILNIRCGDYISLIQGEAKKYDKFDELMLISVMHQESKCDSEATSGSSYGLMQISSFEMCSKIGTENEIKTNVKTNIECGASILKKKMTMFAETMNYDCELYKFTKERTEPKVNYAYDKGTIEYALRGYNGWGCASSSVNADHEYVKEVLAIYEKLREIHEGLDKVEKLTEREENIPFDSSQMGFKVEGVKDFSEFAVDGDIISFKIKEENNCEKIKVVIKKNDAVISYQTKKIFPASYIITNLEKGIYYVDEIICDGKNYVVDKKITVLEMPVENIGKIEMTYDEGLFFIEDFFSYQWNSNEEEVKSEIKTRNKWGAWGYKTIDDMNIDNLLNNKEKDIHRAIMSQKNNWKNVIKLAVMYDELYGENLEVVFGESSSPGMAIGIETQN